MQPPPPYQPLPSLRPRTLGLAIGRTAAWARARTSTLCLFCPLLLSFPPSEPGADWLEDRLESVYKQHPGYSDKASTLFTIDLGAPEELPDALRGEKWSFVQLPLGTLQQVGRAGQCAGAASAGGLQTARRADPCLAACSSAAGWAVMS